jgi:hypothetical protein
VQTLGFAYGASILNRSLSARTAFTVRACGSLKKINSTQVDPDFAEIGVLITERGWTPSGPNSIGPGANQIHSKATETPEYAVAAGRAPGGCEVFAVLLPGEDDVDEDLLSRPALRIRTRLEARGRADGDGLADFNVSRGG